MIDCTPQALVTGASCFYCKTPNIDSIEIYLLCYMAGGTVPSSSHLLLETGGGILIEGGGNILLESDTAYPPNPYAYWKLDEEDPAVELVNVISAFNLQANTISGASVPGIIGNAQRMGYLGDDWWQNSATAHWPMAGSFTVRFWIKPVYHVIAGSDAKLLMAGNESPSPRQWAVALTNDFSAHMTLNLEVTTTGALASVTSPALTSDAWSHVMVWFEQGVGVSIQINNGPITFTANASPIQPFPGGAELHLRKRLGAQPIYMDEIAIWNKLLTDAQRATDYNTGSGITFPL